ncbi:MAG: OmpA family protein [Polyangiaceae bacterium]
MTTNDGWMPRLTEGVSIWKLAQDLNQAALMDGALIVPETEGNPNAPRVVRWHVRNLVPLDEARARRPSEVERAIATFEAATKRLERALEERSSAYHAFRGAFSLPALSSEHYFFDTHTEKLHVIHWGAEPRSHGARGETVHGFGDLARVFVASTESPPATRRLSDAAKDDGAPTPRGEALDPSRFRSGWIIALAVLAALALTFVALRQRSSSVIGATTDFDSSTSARATTSATVTAVKLPLTRESLVPLDKPLLFEYGSARIDAQAEVTLQRAAAYLSIHPEVVRVRIEGHADASGEDDKNFVLSTARALAVKRALLAAGVDAERLTVDAHGQANPAVPDAGALHLNRRVELWALRHEVAGDAAL